MVRLIILAAKKQGLSKAEFREYYETKHVPLVQRIMGTPDEYTRSYVDAAEELSHKWSGTPLIDFPYDAIVHFVFKDPRRLDAWFQAYNDHRDEIAADEEKFADRSRARLFITEDETVTA